MKTLKRLSVLAVGSTVCALATLSALAEEAAGKWIGQLPPPVGLHIVLVIEKNAQGRYKGVLRSPDQGSGDLSVTSVEASPDHLKFTEDTHGIAYEAHWDDAKKAWVGIFRQSGGQMALDLTRSNGPDRAPDPLPNSPVLAPVEGLDGAWAGDLEVGQRTLRMVLRVVRVDRGVKAGLDSLDQGARGLPVTRLEREGDKVVFALEKQGASYKGTLSAGVITGVFSQGGHDLMLDLRKQDPSAAQTKPRRPQEEAIAAAPLPYREEEVVFDNRAAPRVKLAGTLTLPKGAGPFAAVVLISGSGPNARDEEVAGHKLFLVLADHLARQGLAVLRYDKRGIGKSTGNYAAATSDDFTSDAESAVAYLRGRPEVDRGKLGLIGHSEGGLIAPLVAVEDPSLAFIVMMAGTGIPGRILLAEQQRLIKMASGMPAEEADVDHALSRRVFDAIAQSKDAAEAQARARAIEESANPEPPQAAMDHVAAIAASAWFRRFLAYDPVPTLQKVRVPTLVLNGSLDLQVPPSIDLPPIRKAMADNPDLTVIEMKGLNHLFQHATTGSPAEYARIQETLAPELLDTLSDWIGKQVR